VTAVTTLVSSGLNGPWGVAVDGEGNIYIADTGNNAIKEWTVVNNTVTTLVSSGCQGIALYGWGNVYIADTGNNAVNEWIAASNTLTTLVSSGLTWPYGVAVDGSGNVYIADTLDVAIKEWIAASNTLVTLVSWNNYTSDLAPYGVALDAAGNVYIAAGYDSYGECDECELYSAIQVWSPVNNTLTTLVSSGLLNPYGVAVDGAGNVYFADSGDGAVKEWIAVSNTVTTLVSGLGFDVGVAVDATGNVYIGDTDNNAIKELPYAFVDPTPKPESSAAGSDSLPAVLPVTENLLPPFAPSSDQSWLTITGITNGVVSFSFMANTGPARTAHITLLGQSIPITQAAVIIGTPPTLTGMEILGNGLFQFSFTNTPGASFTVVSATNLLLPLSNWTVVGNPVESPAGMYQFTSQPNTNISQTFYGVTSP
jgi:sugar lactone lactonase YvrE